MKYFQPDKALTAALSIVFRYPHNLDTRYANFVKPSAYNLNKLESLNTLPLQAEDYAWLTAATDDEMTPDGYRLYLQEKGFIHICMNDNLAQRAWRRKLQETRISASMLDYLDDERGI